MTKLILDGHELVVDDSTAIKLIAENPYVSTAEDYTLEISVPLGCKENQSFFPSWNIIEKTKEQKTYDAMLIAENRTILKGTGKITRSTEKDLKLQLFAGKSAFNVKFENTYIDSLKLPYTKKDGEERGNINIPMNGIGKDGYIGDKTKGVVVPVYDESNGEVVNPISHVYGPYLMPKLWQYYGPAFPDPYDWDQKYDDIKPKLNWNLLYVISSVFKALGYEVDLSAFQKRPYDIVFTAIPSNAMEFAMPHWTVKDFIEQIELLFNATFEIKEDTKSIRLSQNTKEREIVTYESADEFSIEYTEDEDIKDNNFKNLQYVQSDSEFRLPDMINEETLKTLPKKSFNSYFNLQQEYAFTPIKDKDKYIWVCPEGTYTPWRHTYLDENKKEHTFISLTKINEFGAKIKDEDGQVTELRICPASMAENIAIPVYYECQDSGQGTHTTHVDEIPDDGDKRTLTYAKLPVINSSVKEEVEIETYTIQDIVEGNESPEEKEEEAIDRMDIIFVDGTLNEMNVGSPYDVGETRPWGDMPIPMGYVSSNLHNRPTVNHEDYTMALKDLGRNLREEVTYKVDYGKKYTIKFVSDSMPDAKKIFLFNNKKFICAKIETNIANGKLEKLMTGEFYMIE